MMPGIMIPLWGKSYKELRAGIVFVVFCIFFAAKTYTNAARTEFIGDFILALNVLRQGSHTKSMRVMRRIGDNFN